VAITAPRTALLEALHGDVILTARARNIQHIIVDDGLDLVHTTKHRGSLDTISGFHDDMEIRPQRNHVKSNMRQRPASAYPFHETDIGVGKQSSRCMQHSASAINASAGINQRLSSNKKGSAPPIALKSTQNRIVPQTSAYLQWLKTSERLNRNPPVSASTQERYQAASRVTLTSLPRVTYSSNLGSNSIETDSKGILRLSDQSQEGGERDIDLDSFNDSAPLPSLFMGSLAAAEMIRKK